MRTVVSAALAAVVVGGLVAGCGDPGGKPDALSWCPTVPGYTVECGQVQRPLVADRPDLGTVDIGYALVRHGKDVPSAGTVVPNPGGPGVPMIAHAAEAVAVSEHLLADHDLLLIDPRGTGVSSPLDCGIDARQFQLGTREQQLAAVEHCGAQLGSRAAGYTSAAAADDFDAVRERLGVPKLVLYGISYGTYLMPVYAQRHPDHVQSIVLTGAYSPDMNQLGTANAEAVSLALQRICERSRACDGNAAVADLAAVAQRMRTRPITVATDHGPLLLDEGKLGNLVFEAGTSNVGAHPEQLVPLGMLPAALHGAVRGDDRGISEFVRATTDEPAYENIGSYVAVTCNDYPTLWSPDASLPQREQQYRQALANPPAESGAFSVEGFGAALRDGGDSCIRWPGLKNHQRPDQMREPLPNVPVLVLSGDLDAITPDANGKRAAARFANATFVSVPNTGHVPDLEPSGCVTGIVAEFVRTGAPGSTACLSAIPPIAVTPVAG